MAPTVFKTALRICYKSRIIWKDILRYCNFGALQYPLLHLSNPLNGTADEFLCQNQKFSLVSISSTFYEQLFRTCNLFLYFCQKNKCIGKKSAYKILMKFTLGQWFPNFFCVQTTENNLVVSEAQNIDLYKHSRTTSGPRSRLWESLFQDLALLNHLGVDRTN